MKQAKIIQLIVLAIVLLVVAAVAFFLGDKHAVQTMTIKRVTPDQAAVAMKGDYFYSNYRENTLLVSGTVSVVSKTSNDLIVTFKTSAAFETMCDFGNFTSAIRPGDTITALSEGGLAERQPSAVLLKNCVLP